MLQLPPVGHPSRKRNLLDTAAFQIHHKGDEIEVSLQIMQSQPSGCCCIALTSSFLKWAAACCHLCSLFAPAPKNRALGHTHILVVPARMCFVADLHLWQQSGLPVPLVTEGDMLVPVPSHLVRVALTTNGKGNTSWKTFSGQQYMSQVEQQPCCTKRCRRLVFSTVDVVIAKENVCDSHDYGQIERHTSGCLLGCCQ